MVPVRTLREPIGLAARRESERGYAILLDEDYAAEVERIVRERKSWAPRSWESIVNTGTLPAA